MSIAKAIVHPYDARETGIGVAVWLLLYAGILSAFGVGMILLACKVFSESDKTEGIQQQVRMASSRVVDIAYAWECPECKNVVLTETKLDRVYCKSCQRDRVILGVTANDPDMPQRIEAERRKARERDIQAAYDTARISAIAAQLGACQ